MKRWVSFSLVIALVVTNVIVFSEQGDSLEARAREGGISWYCPALGVLTGVSIATGQWISAAGFAVAAGRSGCLW
jgi:hypothetical protein